MRSTDAKEKLTQGIHALTSSEDWKKALAFAARFHSYSFGNTLLIHLQRPDASRVAGFKAWEKLGRHVRHGEHGIAILAPLLRQVRSRDQETGEETVLGQSLSGFRVVFVFDVSQTEGAELRPDPGYFVKRLQGGDERERTLFRILAAALGRKGWDAGKSSMDKHPESENGYTDFVQKVVQVRASLSDAQALKTLLHEFAHALLHDPMSALANRALCETEAESAAYIAAQVIGLETSSYSFGYVAGWSGGKDEVIEAAGRRALRAAREILDALGIHEKEEAA